MVQKFTEKLLQALQEAIQLAESRHHAEVYDLHLIYTLLQDKNGYFTALIRELNASLESLEGKIATQLSSLPTIEGEGTRPQIHRSLEQLLREAEQIAREWHDTHTSSDHVFLALIRHGREPFLSWKQAEKIQEQDVKEIIRLIKIFNKI